MLFNSFEFLLFFPLVTIAFFLIPRWAPRMWLLLAASCYFYMAFIPAYVLILAFIIVIDYVAALWMARAVGMRRAGILAISILANVGLLAVFKYWNFGVTQLVRLGGVAGLSLPLPMLHLILPIGLSFHTFQALSYTIEVYKGRQPPERNFLVYALYVMFYPQLVAGPIERPYNLLPQLHRLTSFDYERAVSGLQLMAWGLFKKVVIADRLALYVDAVYGNPRGYEGAALVLATWLFAFQIFCDFSGYSDIAIGAARVMGYDLMQNFRRPYAAASVAEFWRRWHISLSTWFRDYLYRPLGGSRVPPVRWAFNIMVVFMVSGLWHGANWTFVAWGLVHGLFIVSSAVLAAPRDAIAAAVGLDRYPRLRHALGVVLTFNLVAVAWVFFRAGSMRDAFYILGHVWPLTVDLRLEAAGLNGFELAVGLLAIAVVEVVHHLQSRGPVRPRIAGLAPGWRWAVYYTTVFVLIVFGRFGSRQFIYFQF